MEKSLEKQSNLNNLELLIEKYEQIIICVQKTNDLDTCSCALALAEIIREKFKDKKSISILGIYGKSKFLTEMRNYDNKKLDWGKDTLLILSEVSSKRQVNEYHIDNVKRATETILIDHHEVNEEEENELKEFLGKDKPFHVLRDSKYTSVCEVLGEFIKFTKGKPTRRICEILFMGIYSDIKSFTAETINEHTFRNISEMIEATGMEIGKVVNQMKHRPMSHLMLFADTLKNAVYEGNLLFLSLNPRDVYKYIPRMMIKGKNGKLRQKTMLTYIPRGISEYTTANTIVFSHYSLYDPYNSQKKLVYVIITKENPALEQILRQHRFKKNRNRGSREMTFSDLTGLIEQYKVIFTA